MTAWVTCKYGLQGGLPSLMAETCLSGDVPKEKLTVMLSLVTCCFDLFGGMFLCAFLELCTRY